ncbi:MAG TPA: hypothetical protein VHH91_11630, partial [Vicinamibacterales bacterium]|nr:hypothetical protein [Vicinamibacterales bacterium]
MSRSTRFRTAWRTAAIVGFLAGSMVPAAQEPQPTFRGGIDLVTVRAIVRDGRGRPVLGLKQADFELRDRGAARRIVSFDREPGPVGVALLFDVSGSMDMGSKLD